jgi:hypothetical protein
LGFTAAQCAATCGTNLNNWKGFMFAPFNPGNRACRCPDLFEESDPSSGWYLYGPSSTVVGDPHITTLDGEHTLLSQGTFSLWHFSGLTDLHSEEVAGTKKFPVDWQVYAQYSDLFRPPVLHQGPASHRPGCDVEITSQEKWQDVESTEKRKQSRNESIGK